MYVLNCRAWLLSAVFIASCGGGNTNNNAVANNGAVCDGKIELNLSAVDSMQILPLDLTAGTSHPWGGQDQGGYSIRGDRNGSNFNVTTHTTQSAECATIYDYFNLGTRQAQGKLYNHDIFFSVLPRRYHEANAAVFADMAALSAADKVDAAKNTALNNAYNAGVLDQQLMFVGIDPTDTIGSTLGGRLVPTTGNTQIVGSFDKIELTCGQNFTVKPILLPEYLSSGYVPNRNFCALRPPLNDPQGANLSYCVNLMVEAPPQGTLCTFVADVAINNNVPDTLIPPVISGVSIPVHIAGRLERLANNVLNSDVPSSHRWKLYIDNIQIKTVP